MVKPLSIACLVLSMVFPSASRAGDAPAKIRVLLVIGGHDFEREPFLDVFRSNPEITFETVGHPDAHARLSAEAARSWDVLALYDMWQPISDAAKADFLARLKDGKGIVVLHHAIANYQKWNGYARIIGGKYFLANESFDGRDHPASTYKDDVRFTVEVERNNHPVTRGVENFEIVDENYHGLWVDPSATVLLRTKSPTNHPILAWARTEQASRVVYLQLGHGPSAFGNTSYRKLLAQSIRWTAGRSE
ncbi:MAG: ThuA domain-containing protein [Verrucomicrobia bacterium]|nr:ThuA domain-containing protein [Verrucomicrobiota bacterium]